MAAAIALLLVLLSGVASAVGSVVNIQPGGDAELADGVYSQREGQTGTISFEYQGPGAAAQGQSLSITIDGTTITQGETAMLSGVSFTPVKTGTNRFAIEVNAVRSSLPPIALAQAGEGTIPREQIDFAIFVNIFTNDPAYDARLASAISFRLVAAEFIGPWTLSRLDEAQRNNPCLRDAMNLARTIVMSAQGQAAYAKVNLPDADIKEELADGQDPEIDNEALDGANGVYKGDSADIEDQFELDDSFFENCGPDATEQQKKNTTMMMVSTILHETAHWKDDNKKHPKDADGNEPADHDTEGEEGRQLETDLFGGNMDQTGDGDAVTIDGDPVSDDQVDEWLAPANWPPPAAAAGSALTPAGLSVAQAADFLDVTLAIADPDFEFGESLIADVTFTNTSAGPIDVMNRVVLEGYPLHFNILNADTGVRVSFAGPEIDFALSNADFTILQSGESLSVSVDLLRDSANGREGYALQDVGTYEVTAVYEQIRSLARSVSNVVQLRVGGTPPQLVPLAAGWNLVGWSGATSLADATVSIAGQFSSMFTWDASNQKFRLFNASALPFLNTLTELTLGDGVWLRVSDPSGATWEQPAFNAARTVALLAGFNLVMWTGPDGTAVTDAIAGFESSVDAVFAWDAAGQRFLSFRPSALPFLNDLELLNAGDVVWLSMSAAATWDQPAR